VASVKAVDGAGWLGHLGLTQPDSVIGLTDVSKFATAIRLRTQQHVDTGALCFRPDEKLRQLGAGNHETDAAPVALFHDAQSFRNAGGNEHAESEGLGWGDGES